MWSQPGVLLWPIAGWEFPEGHVPASHWLRVHFMRPPGNVLDIAGIILLFVVITHLLLARHGKRQLKAAKFLCLKFGHLLISRSRPTRHDIVRP
jgi:hypothetical protein